MPGPLAGIKIIEFGGMGPCPFAGMMLADHGAHLIRIEQPGARIEPGDPLTRSRPVIRLDLKAEAGAAIARELLVGAAGLIEGFRPGVMERLGFGPDILLAEQPNLVYGRMTGWGQDGPLAPTAGHDINYIAMAGVLHMIGRAGEKPVPPVNLVGDYGGGGMLLAFGMVSALLAVQRGSPGQVIDCAMTDGAALLAASAYGRLGRGHWLDDRGVNLLDTGAPFYDTYECSDGRYIAVGSLEPQFYASLLALTGLEKDPVFARQNDRDMWPQMRTRLTEIFRSRSRDEWQKVFAGSKNSCCTPVLSLEEAPLHPHVVAREGFVDLHGIKQPAPAPRYSVTSLDRPRYDGASTDVTDAKLIEAGCGADSIRHARLEGALH